MGSYLSRRLASSLLVMLIVAVLIFSMLFAAPGDPAAIIAGNQATVEDIARIRENLGLDRPYLVQFGSWFAEIARGNLGTSMFSGVPVLTMIRQAAEPTISLMVLTIIISVIVAVPAGVISAWKGGTMIDRAVMGFAILSFSIPVFVVGYTLAYVFAVKLGLLPVQGYSPIGNGMLSWLRSLVLPSVALAGVYSALIARVTRASMLDVLRRDYIRTAKAKGVPRRRILFRHALKNASVPVVTVIGAGVALLIGGSVVTETVFAIPGIGRLTVDAVLRRDYPVIQGVVLVLSFIFVVVNLLVDLLYVVLDPRIRY